MRTDIQLIVVAVHVFLEHLVIFALSNPDIRDLALFDWNIVREFVHRRGVL